MTAETQREGTPAWEAFKKTMTLAPNLWTAAKDDDVRTLHRLLRAGADIEAKDARGYSALMLAAYSGSVQAFEFLLACGADPNTSDASGNTVLMGAAFKGHGYFVAKLVAAGADLRTTNEAGMDARAFAANFGRANIVELLDRLSEEVAKADALI
jgi:ankyrin repeat protein